MANSAQNDTTTELFSGSGGDKMDESLVTQADGSTQAKRPRIVLGTDTGALVGRMHPVQVESVEIVRSLARIERLLEVLIEQAGGVAP